MRFGRVEGTIVPLAEKGRAGLRLTVWLETGTGFDVVRDEVVSLLRPLATPEDLAWHADQYTQETIAVDLAAEGWEAIGAADPPVPEPGEIARSASYAVRNLG